MRPLLNVLTVIFFIIGFFIPIVWVLAVVTAVSSIASAADGPGTDASESNYGMTNGMGDDKAGSHKSKSCPACLGIVSRYAAKCQFCGEILEVTPN